ncbi:uncharacterized protein A1O5_12639 [Cladophialophora psammophila CBS 110553]|uniref:DNA-directed RNA polymerase III subunit RPC9 n=1 Tax=Cladophialophora psammophila CBS 110553 TaxID=1182543 RepID=W9VL36_9EURO|nr:uncharacterized protein A1O5_12639 [Cladophialophora psammophila CBS 110553]EXJ56372.1 hypothetical protein A1O5_12639 [Cladophialophora psammophila CBS 110553]
MRVLDPQSALLTTPEVYQFLRQKPSRPPPRKIGSYKQIDLKDNQRVLDDFKHYVTNTVPFITKYPPIETFIKNVVPRLRAFGLTKTEALMLINLGLGLPRGQQQQQAADDNAQMEGVTGEGDDVDDDDDAAAADETNGQRTAEGEEEPLDPDDRQFLSLVVEELEERFPGEEGEAQIQKILETMREEYNRAHAMHASSNGNTNVDDNELMDVS